MVARQPDGQVLPQTLPDGRRKLQGLPSAPCAGSSLSPLSWQQSLPTGRGALNQADWVDLLALPQPCTCCCLEAWVGLPLCGVSWCLPWWPGGPLWLLSMHLWGIGFGALWDSCCWGGPGWAVTHCRTAFLCGHGRCTIPQKKAWC